MYRFKSIDGQSEFMAADGVAVIGLGWQFKRFYGDGLGGFVVVAVAALVTLIVVAVGWSCFLSG